MWRRVLKSLRGALRIVLRMLMRTLRVNMRGGGGRRLWVLRIRSEISYMIFSAGVGRRRFEKKRMLPRPDLKTYMIMHPLMGKHCQCDHPHHNPLALLPHWPALPIRNVWHPPRSERKDVLPSEWQLPASNQAPTEAQKPFSSARNEKSVNERKGENGLRKKTRNGNRRDSVVLLRSRMVRLLKLLLLARNLLRLRHARGKRKALVRRR
ncbi:hypothetical protein EMCG_09264 [[Emmonsia] crescens]|uniref:Uncharacterized protein n=1 Tax=[Emmonsia] crescens TaxID=73230 RepID=A0A0G2I372_9EURO|nr:hypothetical protein EMCG_09264 [Emmonsia crescens UAMH 3008]